MRAMAKELADLLGGVVACSRPLVEGNVFDAKHQIGLSGEHGIGYAKKEFLKRQYGETPVALMQGIKQVFDPKNILNPGKVCF